MKVNINKTQVMVFRNGGPLRRNEKWFYRGQQVKVTSYYDYLGLCISCMMNWSKATNNLSMKALKALNVIKLFASKFQCTDVKVLLSLFDKMVLPILMYGAEVWGTEYRKSIERVQIKFCKYVLGVGSRTSDIAVLGECGRCPLFVHYYCKVIKYWTRLLCMNDENISKQCYWMLKKLDENNRHNWVTDLKGLLFRYGYGVVWFAQELGDPDHFVRLFKQRLTDCATQEWHSALCASPKLSFYSDIKSLLNIERYLSVISKPHLRRAMSCFRCSSHSLEIERGRYSNINRNSRLCMYCQLSGINVVEDEFHFLVKCPLYDDIRENYLLNVYSETCTNIAQIMNSKSNTILLKLSKYIYYSFNRRNAFLST